jgi:hypothetical protein
VVGPDVLFLFNLGSPISSLSSQKHPSESVLSIDKTDF